MFIDRETRETLEILSKEVFGNKSRYQKFLDKGTTALVTKTVEEIIPGENGAESTTKTIEVPVLTKSGAKQYYQKYYTVDEVVTLLLTFKEKRDAFLAEMKKHEDEQKSKKEQEDLVNKINQQVGGSAL